MQTALVQEEVAGPAWRERRTGERDWEERTRKREEEEEESMVPGVQAAGKGSGKAAQSVARAAEAITLPRGRQW